MGCKGSDLSVESSVSPSLSDTLLFTTMCIIGLQVEVQVKDGSIYSGVFHTACVEKDYGIVLKKAKMTKEGKKDTNLANGSVIETLVILSDDLVQVIAKGVMLPGDGIDANATGEDSEAVNVSIKASECSQNELKLMNSSKASVAKRKQNGQTRISNLHKNKSIYRSTHIDVGGGQILKEVAAKSGESEVICSRKLEGQHSPKIEETSSAPVIATGECQVGEDKSQLESNGSTQKLEASKDKTIHDTNLSQLVSINGRQVEISAKIPSDRESPISDVPSHGKPDIGDSERPTVAEFLSSDAPEISTSSTTGVDINSQSCPSRLVSATVSVASKVSTTNSKEFKLNPRAKTFSPVLGVPRAPAPPAAVTVASMAYIQNTPTVVPVAATQQEIITNRFAPNSSLPIKFVHYNNLVAVNDVNASQYPQPIVGHLGSRPQAVRYAGHYAPFQAGPTYVHPHSQPVMVSRLGQLVYVHPVSHDVTQSATTPSPHPMFAHTQPHLPKQQGIAAAAAAAAQGLQICATPPPFISGQQPFTVPVHIPLSQPPFPNIRPILVPGPNTNLVSKFI